MEKKVTVTIGLVMAMAVGVWLAAGSRVTTPAKQLGEPAIRNEAASSDVDQGTVDNAAMQGPSSDDQSFAHAESRRISMQQFEQVQRGNAASANLLFNQVRECSKAPRTTLEIERQIVVEARRHPELTDRRRSYLEQEMRRCAALDERVARKEWEITLRAAESGNAKAAVWLFRGIDATTIDDPKFDYYRESQRILEGFAETGDVEVLAALAIGAMGQDGRPQDLAKAYEYFYAGYLRSGDERLLDFAAHVSRDWDPAAISRYQQRAEKLASKSP